MELPKYPKLRTLICAKNNVKNISDIYAIYDTSNIYNTNNIYDTSNIHNTNNQLETLVISETKIKYVPTINSLIILDCRNSAVLEIGEFKNLRKLHCDDTKITRLPNLPALTNLSCCGSTITKIPPNLKWVECRKTCITEEPINCDGIWNTCKWLEPSFRNISKLKIIQKYFRQKTKERRNKIKQITSIKDLNNLIINY
jgi:hypothetical protein